MVHVINLGCPKNLVDSEILLGLLEKKGVPLTDKAGEAETIIINTCGFIEMAKEESIDAILGAARLKETGCCQQLLVIGCLSERYPKELKEEIPEVDGFFGINEFDRILKTLGENGSREAHGLLNYDPNLLCNRRLLTPGHYAYLRIADGCDNGCSFCAIPLIRGPYHSLRIEEILQEAETLAGSGVRELIVVAQDITHYGIDLYGESRLLTLLERLTRIGQIRWIRLLYLHPPSFSDELLGFIADQKKICRYLDFPVEHISDRILNRMGRRINKHGILDWIERIRNTLPDVALRTSLIVGYPGEGEKEFQELMAFVRNVSFERLGVFAYSREEGTAAFHFSQQVPEGEKQRRRAEIMSLQQEISFEKNRSLEGKQVEVLVDSFEDSSGFSIGRTQWDAPGVDQEVLLTPKVEVGEFYKVRITEVYEYDLVGEVICHSGS